MGLDEQALQALWQRTVGGRLDAPDLTPGRTYKAPDEAGAAETGALPRSTLSGGGTLAPAGTLSGGGTLAPAGTLSGQGTLASGDAPGVTGGEGSSFRLLDELGRGGMGVVFKAHQESLRREVAIKQLLGRQDDPHLRQRFLSEALVTGVLDHPNVVPVHELGLTPAGELFMAMKLVGGTSWADLLHPRTPAHQERARRHDREAHVQTLLAVCNAIAFAHSKGIVHRDIKPENVMVGDFGEVLVMDWGIAVDVSERPSPDARAPHRTTVAGPSGTPSYMPPELAEGRGQDIGPWTDVYLLGATLHEVLTGAPPHQGRTLVEVLLAAARSAPPRYGPDVPQGLAAICRKAMARDPKERYPTVAALQDALREYLEHRESLLLSERGDEDLRALEGQERDGGAPEQARAGLAGHAEGRSRDGSPSREAGERLRRTHHTDDRDARYERFARAIARYEQALDLWPDNAAARQGARRARLAHAEEALARGDLGLAAAQLAPLPHDDADAARARADVDAAQRERAAAARRARGLRVVAVTSLVAALGVLGVGYHLVSTERDAAVKAREEALQAREAEAREREKATAAEQEAQARAREARERLRLMLTQRAYTEREPVVGALHVIATLDGELAPEVEAVQRLRARSLLETSTPPARALALGWDDAALTAAEARGARSAVFTDDGRAWALTDDERVVELALDDPALEASGAPIALPPLGTPDEPLARSAGRLVAAGPRLLAVADQDLVAIDLQAREVAWTRDLSGHVVVDATGSRLAIRPGGGAKIAVVDAATGEDVVQAALPPGARDLTLVGFAGERLWAVLQASAAPFAWLDPKTGRWTTHTQVEQVHEARVSPDGGLIAVVDKGGARLCLVDPTSLATRVVDAGEPAERTLVAWPSPTRLAALRLRGPSDAEGTLDLDLIDVETLHVERLETHVPRRAEHPAVIATNDGRRLIVASGFGGLPGDSRVHVIDLRTGWPVCPALVGAGSYDLDALAGLSASPDGNLLVGADVDPERAGVGPVRVWALSEVGPSQRGTVAPLDDAALLALEDEAIEPGHALNVRIGWRDPRTPEVRLLERASGREVRALAGAPPVLTAMEPESWDEMATSGLGYPDEFNRQVVHVVTSRDGRLCAVVFGMVQRPPTDQVPPSGRFRLRVVDVASGEWLPFERLGSTTKPVLRFTPGGERLVILWDGALEALDVPSGRVERLDLPAALLEREDAYVDAYMRLSQRAPSALLAGAGGAAVASIGSTLSLGPVSRLGAPAALAALFDDVAGGPRGVVVAGSEVHVFDLARGAPAYPPLRVNDAVQDVDVSPDGRFLVLQGDVARVFELATGEPVGGPLKVDAYGPSVQLAFAPTGGLVALGRGGALQLYELATALPVTGVIALPGAELHDPAFELVNGRLTLLASERSMIDGTGPVRRLAWSLEPDGRAVDALRAEAELRARRRLDAGGYPVPLSREEAAERAARLGPPRVARPPAALPPGVLLEAPAPGARTTGRWTPVRARLTDVAPGARAVVWARAAGGAVETHTVSVGEDGVVDVPGMVLPRGGDAVRVGVRVVGSNGREGGASADVTVGPVPPPRPPAGLRRARTERLPGGGEVEVWERALPAGPPLELVRVPAGPYVVGHASSREDAPLALRFAAEDLWIGRTEVTWAQYRAFCQATGREPPPAPDVPDVDRHPVVGVTWADAVAFATWAGAALPTREERERAARGPREAAFPWGDDFGAGRCSHGGLEPRAWNKPDASDGFAGTAPVGSFPDDCSPFGLVDVAGNVKEWCADEVEVVLEDTYGDLDPAERVKVQRALAGGGSYLSGAWDAGLWLRRAAPPDEADPTIGLRVVVRAP